MLPRYAALLSLCCLLAGAATAQTAGVRGFVVDAGDEQPLQGASVVLLQGEALVAGTAADGDGYFIVGRVPPGRYTLRATFIGYAPYETTLDLGARALPTLRIALAAAEAAIDEVVVEGERTGAAVTTAGLQTIRGADLDRIPMPGVTSDLVGHLQAAPSVVSSGDRGGQYYVRGGEPTQNLVLLDGIPLYQPFHILGFYSAFPAEIVNAADVHAGGFGARFGGRLSSVLNVSARNGNKRRFEGGGSVAPFLSTLRVEGPLVPGRVSLLASVRESLVESLMPDLYGQKMPYRFGDRFVKLHALPTRGSSVSVTALHTHDAGDVAGSQKTILGDVQHETSADTTRVDWQNRAVGARLLLLPGRLPVLAELSASFTRLDTGVENAGDDRREATVEGLNAGLDLTYLLGGREVRVGAFAQQTTLAYHLDGLLGGGVDDREERLTEAGAYVELDLGADSTFRVVPGLRLHSFPNRSRLALEPRLRVTKAFVGVAGAQQLSAAAGLYHQGIVGLTDERDAGNVFTAWTAAPEEAPVPQALHLILGWQTRYRAAPDVPVQASFEVYHKRLSHLYVPHWDPFPQFTTTLQEARGRISGLDARVEVNHPAFYGYVGYGMAKTTYEAVDGEVFGAYYGEVQTAYQPPHDRRHQLSAVGRLRHGPFAVSFHWQYGSGLPYTRALGFDDWVHLSGEDVDLRSDPGRYRVLYEVPYSSRLPAYHRLDLWLERSFEHKRLHGMLRAGVVNAYNRANLFYFDLFTLRRVEQLPAIPSVGLRLEIR